MDYNIAGTDITLTDEIRTYVERCLAHLDRMVNGGARTDVHVRYRASEEKMFCTELLLHAPGVSAPLRASARAGTLHEAIDIAVAELTRELTNIKKKRVHILRRTGVRVKEYLRGWRDKF